MRVTKTRIQSSRAKLILSLSGALTLFNFFAFIGIGAYFGGSAMNGYVRDGHYFLCAHGGCSEVSRSIWNYSCWHAVATIACFLIVGIEWAIFVKRKDIVFDFDQRA